MANRSTTAEHTGPHTVDIHVGAAIRLRRKSLNLSQQQLATAIGLTFQQLQKYEKGTNRVSASKLYDIAQAMKVPVDWFFRGFGDEGDEFDETPSERTILTFLQTREGVELAQAFPRIRQPNIRRRIVELVKSMANE
jgi:transcriptional regulator with XRE-family HTH domain